MSTRDGFQANDGVSSRQELRPGRGEVGRHDGIADVVVAQLLAAVEISCRTPLEPQQRNLLLLRAAMCEISYAYPRWTMGTGLCSVLKVGKV